MRKTAVIVAVLLVFAGCSGQSGTATPEDTGGTTPSLATTQQETTGVQRVEVAELEASLGDVNATEVWLRVLDLTGLERPSSPPDVVVLTREAEARVTPTPFQRSLGAENYTASSGDASGQYQPRSDTVSIRRTPNSTDEQTETTLAHEFAHVLQYRHSLTSFPDDDGLATQTAIEGAAKYVEWQYAERFGSADPEANYRRIAPELRPVAKLGYAPYYHGAKWVRNHSDPDAPLESTFENQPTTAEQVLHDLPPGSEPPRNLTTHGESGATGTFDFASRERRGEAELRFLLEYGLSSTRAERAAAGWGEDRWMRFANASADGYGWVIRWDSGSEAREFEALFADFGANVSEPLRLEPVGEETTVVFSGREAFVENATATGTAGNVTVAAGD